MKNNRYLWIILIVALLGIVFYLSYSITYEKLTSKPITIHWDNKNSIVAYQEKTNIAIYSKLKKGCGPIV